VTKYDFGFFKGSVQCFSMQVVMNTLMLSPKSWKKIGSRIVLSFWTKT